jgi:hypothetical protein
VFFSKGSNKLGVWMCNPAENEENCDSENGFVVEQDL